MSMIPINRLPLLAGLFCLLLAGASDASAGVTRASVTVGDNGPVRVEGRFASPVRSFSFLDSRGGIVGLSSRIRDLTLLDEEGNLTSYRRGPSGSVFADAEVSVFSYTADLSPPEDPTQGAHVSWLSKEKGILMLADLLPAVEGNLGPVELRLAIGDGRHAATLEEPGPDGTYSIEDPSKAVFLVGSEIRETAVEAKGALISIAIEGEWQFSDELAAKMTDEIFRHYEDVFDALPARKIRILIARAPDPDLKDRWRAETRGNTIVIVSSPSLYRNHGEQRIHEQLRHEILHLWIPNSLNLSGDYSWFYEGFAFYRALIAGVQLGQITFPDVMRTLNESRENAQRSGAWMPLADVSDAAAGDSGGDLYSRGTLTAFACDVLLMSASSGRKNLDDVLKSVYRDASKTGEGKNANEFLIRKLAEWNELRPTVEGSVKGSTSPDWNDLARTAGIVQLPFARGRPAVTLNPTSAQKAILRRLGYNKRR